MVATSSRRDYIVRYAASLSGAASARITRWLQALSQAQYAFLLAVLGLCLLFCAAAITPSAAFAEEAGSITITSQDGTIRNYSAYQLLAGHVENGQVLSATTEGCVPAGMWTDLGAPSAEPEVLAAWLSAQLNVGGPAKGAFLDSLRDAVRDSVNTAERAGTQIPVVTFATGEKVNLGQGYWIILSGKARPILALVAAGENPPVVEKATVPKADKEIFNDATNSWGMAAALEIGKPLRYRLIGTLPSNIDEYVTYTYWFVDAPGPGLSLNPETVKAEIVHEDGSTTDLPLLVETSTKGTMRIGADDIKAMHSSWLATDKLAVEYTANVTAEALREGIVPNEVEVEYSNQPDIEERGTTTLTVAYAFTYNVDTYKVEQGTTTALSGAKFTLQNSEGKYLSANEKWVDTADENCIYTTDSTGHVVFSGLGASTYLLEEVEAPAGHEKLSAPVTVTIVANAEDASQFNVTVETKGSDKASLLGVDGTSLTARVQVEDPKTETPGEKPKTPENPKTPETPFKTILGKLPQTSDAVKAVFAVVVAVVAGAIAAFASTRKKRKDEGPPGR